jgi:hypothetical protein
MGFGMEGVIYFDITTMGVRVYLSGLPGFKAWDDRDELQMMRGMYLRSER